MQYIMLAMNRLPLLLMIIGVAPFIAFSAALAMHVFPNTPVAASWLLTYAAIIISFLGGAHWGVAVLRRQEHRRMSNLLIAESVLPPLVAWGILLAGDMYAQLLVMTLLFTLIWAVDSLLYNNAVIPQWFFDLSCIVTPIIVVSLYVAYFGLI